MSCSGSKKHFSQHPLFTGHLAIGLELKGNQNAKSTFRIETCRLRYNGWLFQGAKAPRYLGPKMVLHRENLQWCTIFQHEKGDLK